MNLTTEQLELIILEELDAVLDEKVEKRGDEYVYVDKKGKVRGRHKTKKAAKKQEKAIEIIQSTCLKVILGDKYNNYDDALKRH